MFNVDWKSLVRSKPEKLEFNLKPGIQKTGTVTIKEDGQVMAEGFWFDGSDGSDPQDLVLQWAIDALRKEQSLK